MDQEKRSRGPIQKVGHSLQIAWQEFRFLLTRTRIGFRNRLRKFRNLHLDYVVIPVGGTLPERNKPPRGFFERRLPYPPEPLSLETLNEMFERIGKAENVRGVVIVFRGISTGLARIQNLRSSIKRLQAHGKECIVYTPYLDMAHYFAASAADRIVVPPAANFEVIGLHAETFFLKDTLKRVGIEAEVIQISPYKSALDALDKSRITPEQEEQINWILDENFDVITATIASERNMEQERLKSLIDNSPMRAELAVNEGLIDHISYEDEIAQWLGSTIQESELAKVDVDSIEEDDSGNEPKSMTKARLATWSRGRRILLEHPRRKHRKYIGVVSIEGTITMGPSRRPPIELPIPIFGSNTAGESTLLKLLRQAERDSRMAALILYVDSGGGSALSSDLIWRQVKRISRKIPVITYMGNVAASGGYYVGAAAAEIMAQPLTITGSIGVVSLHLSTAELYKKLEINRVTFDRGKHANLMSDVAPLNKGQREVMWESIETTYNRFKQIVSDGRDIALSALDPICEGRVWTGRQALDKGLIDGHGDFVDTVAKATELSGIQIDERYKIDVHNLFPHGMGYQIPMPFQIPEQLSWQSIRDQWLAESDKPLLVMPFQLTIY